MLHDVAAFGSEVQQLAALDLELLGSRKKAGQYPILEFDFSDLVVLQSALLEHHGPEDLARDLAIDVISTQRPEL
jgi:hypothetical protein